MHVLAAGVTQDTFGSAILWLERSVRIIGVLVILGIFILKRPDWRHIVEILVVLALGIWIVPSMLPPKVSSTVSSWTAGSQAGATGISWAMLAALAILLAFVLWIFTKK